MTKDEKREAAIRAMDLCMDRMSDMDIEVSDALNILSIALVYSAYHNHKSPSHAVRKLVEFHIREVEKHYENMEIKPSSPFSSPQT